MTERTPPPGYGGLVHSEEFVVMLLGYLAAKGLCKDKIQPHELLDAWAEFKREMGMGLG